MSRKRHCIGADVEHLSPQESILIKWSSAKVSHIFSHKKVSLDLVLGKFFLHQKVFTNVLWKKFQNLRKCSWMFHSFSIKMGYMYLLAYLFTLFFIPKFFSFPWWIFWHFFLFRFVNIFVGNIALWHPLSFQMSH